MNILRHYQKLISFALRGNIGFYEAREYLADVLILELEEFIDLKGKKVLDIGGERGEFCKILKDQRNCTAINLEPQTKIGAVGVFSPSCTVKTVSPRYARCGLKPRSM